MKLFLVSHTNPHIVQDWRKQATA